jgi:hypothetical protein
LISWSRSRTKMDRLRNTVFNPTRIILMWQLIRIRLGEGKIMRIWLPCSSSLLLAYSILVYTVLYTVVQNSKKIFIWTQLTFKTCSYEEPKPKPSEPESLHFCRGHSHIKNYKALQHCQKNIIQYLNLVARY